MIYHFFFIFRKEYLKSVLITISQNFPVDSLLLILKQAYIGKEFYNIQWDIYYNMKKFMLRIKKMYSNIFLRRCNVPLNLFDSNTLQVNSHNLLKNGYIKSLYQYFLLYSHYEDAYNKYNITKEQIKKKEKRNNIRKKKLKTLLNTYHGMNKNSLNVICKKYDNLRMYAEHAKDFLSLYIYNSKTKNESELILFNDDLFIQ